MPKFNLKRCRVCGGEAEIIYNKDPYASAYYYYGVECKNCHFRTQPFCDTEEHAIIEWNWSNGRAKTTETPNYDERPKNEHEILWK